MGRDESGAGAGASLPGDRVGSRGRDSAAAVARSDHWADREADGARERRTDAPEFADGEGACGAG